MPRLNDGNDPSQTRVSALTYPGVSMTEEIYDEIPAEYNLPEEQQNSNDTTGINRNVVPPSPKQ